MNQDFNNMNRSSNVQNAEDALSRSIARFESAMERLAGKVEDASHRVQHVADIAKHQKEELVQMKERAREAIAPVMPYVQKASDLSGKTIREVKANPRPYLMTLAGVVGGLALVNFFLNRRSSSSSSLYSNNLGYTASAGGPYASGTGLDTTAIDKQYQ
jgi:hypothetical protein